MENAIPFSVLESDPSVAELEKMLTRTESVLPFDTLILTPKNAEKIFNGQRVKTEQTDGLYKLYKDEMFYGLAEVENGLAKAKIKLC